MSQLPHNLYTPAQVRELDRLAIEEHEISGTVLIERAGSAAFNLLQKRWPEASNIMVLCGTGNNGGDGFVVARLAHEKGYQVRVFQLGDASHIKGDALAALQRLEGAGVSVRGWLGTDDFSATEVFVDAMLGTGFEGQVSGDYENAINIVNESGAGVLAIDVPSGLNAETGGVESIAVRADTTITFIGMKQGLVTGNGLSHCGDIVFEGLGVPAAIYEKFQSQSQVINCDSYAHLLGKRPRDAHKGMFGHVLIVGGDSGMVGAVRMAGEAALRTGAGLVSIATRAPHAVAIASARPELMCHGVIKANDLEKLLAKASVVAIGPGLGQSEWAEDLLSEVLSSQLPLVVDADALNLLAKEKHQRDNWILTPHPGEAARLLDTDTAAIQNDRFGAAKKLADKYGGVWVIKGAGSLVHSKDLPDEICIEGNPGMATAGMGDVLTGVIAALVGQGLCLHDAARLGVCMHARAADMSVAALGERGLMATDLMSSLRRLANPSC